MRLEDWIIERRIAGTIAHVARRAFHEKVDCRNAERDFQAMYIFEALMKHEGDQRQAASAIGVSKMTVNRVVRSLGLTAQDVRTAAKHFQRSADAGRATQS